ncbi:hypothetical protein PV11_06959 [Exophiala sideris]|uniref:HMG box domain-containing protein n=1 Tax=Exophiala sideris TaxID=1016849 RepID=A0A0D1WW36_9EURO|nr:hypothetical protein PV11_06959 [Exophiala sideris]
MTEGTVTAQPPSPPQSADGHHSTGEDSRSNPIAASNPGFSTPPMPVRTIMSQSPQPSFDPYGDPSLYQTAPAPVYYTPRTMITSAPMHTPPQPMPEHGILTRSGRALGTPSSPDTATDSTRASQSPLVRPRRNLKKKPAKKGGPVLDQPLSVLTEDYKTPVRDMAVWVNRPVSERMAEVDRKKGYISRPMNSFMMYRSAYADRVKQFCKENNHQVVSQVTGASWPLEPQEIRGLYEQLAMTERDNHQAAHPNYKFAPNKGGKRSRRDDDDSDSDPDWEGSTRGSKRGRRFDSRSASSTPFEEIPPRYHALPALNLSGYEISNPYGSQPIMVGPDGMMGYYQTTTTMGPYGEQVSDVKYQRMEDPFPPYQTTMGIVGMPQGHHELLTSHAAPRQMVSTQADMLDPRLAQPDPNFHFGYYDDGMNMVQEAPRTITYEPAPPAGYQPAEAYHPGLATLTEEHDVWGDQAQAWSDFEAEFQKMG